MSTENTLEMKIDEFDLLDCLKEKLHAHDIHTVSDLTMTSKATIQEIFSDHCDEDCFLNCCMMDIEFLLKDLGLCLLQEEDAAEEETDAYKKLLEENEALKKEIAFLQQMIEGFTKEAKD